jgi:hypothetical protein
MSGSTIVRPAAGEAQLPENRNCFVVLPDFLCPLLPSLLERWDIPDGKNNTGSVSSEVMRQLEGVPEKMDLMDPIHHWRMLNSEEQIDE